MATQPTNPIVHVAETDGNLAGTGQPNKTVPSAALLGLGYDKNQTVMAEHLNYVLDNIAEWQKFFKDRIDELQAQVEQERLPVGSIFEITGVSTNPATLLGYGTWSAFGEGVTLVGVGSHTDDRGENKTWTDGQTEGEYQHVQTESEMPSHTHSVTGSTNTTGAHVHNIQLSNSDAANDGNEIDSGDEPTIVGNKSTDSAGDHSHTVTGTANTTGGDNPMNNTQPTLAVYRWKRDS